MKMKKTPQSPFSDLYRRSACHANQLAADIYTAADTLKSRSLLSSLTTGDYSSIVSASIDPRDYSSADTFSRDYLCVELMSKFPHWDIGVDRAQVALEKWLEVEHGLESLDFSRNTLIRAATSSSTIRAVEMTARRKIERVLGSFDWDESHKLFAFGPGASTSLSRRKGDSLHKFGATGLQLSYNALPFARALMDAHPTWAFEAVSVAGSRLTTVPKNAKTDRVICIEPDLNMYLQKGIGACIRRRLQRWGLLLPQAQQINARLALEGSANGSLATVDLSSASDSIHMGLVERLLPADWVAAIELTRSPFVVLPDGTLRCIRKVSSMGNGYTFELETLLFWAISSAVVDLLSQRTTDRRLTVFGDDIIVGSELVGPLREVLLYFGFVMNPKKTFQDGPFRESCGKHYFSGVDVTPFYVRDTIDSVPRKYWAANSVRRYARLPVWGLDGRWQPVYRNVITSLPKFFRGFKIPDGFGDVGLVADWDEVRPSRATDQHDAWKFEGIIPKFRKKTFETHGVLLKELHRLERGEREPDDHVDFLTNRLLGWDGMSVEFKSPFHSKWDEELRSIALRRVRDLSKGERVGTSSDIPITSGYRKKVLTAHQWDSYGPWVSSSEDTEGLNPSNDEGCKEISEADLSSVVTLSDQDGSQIGLVHPQSIAWEEVLFTK